MTSDADQLLPNHKSSHRRRTQVSQIPASKPRGLDGIILDILLLILLFSSITKGELLPSGTLSLQEIHLVRCLTHITNRYDANGRNLVILSSAAYGDVQQELVAEIRRTSLRSVVTLHDNISKMYETDFINRYNDFIILTPDGNIKNFYVQMLGQYIDRRNKYTSIWNPETRFIVAGANEFSITQQREIFDSFSQFRIYNCIVINQEHYIIDKEYSTPIKVNDVDTGMKLGLYTWFPYQSSDRCTEVNDITLLDSWVISEQGHFSKNTELFPAKISNNLNGCPMKAVVRTSYWLYSTRYLTSLDSNGSIVTKISGLEFELLNLVLKQMNMSFIHVRTPEGFEIEEGLTNNLIKDMVAKKTYIAVGDVGKNYSIEPSLDSTSTYRTMSFSWYVPCSLQYTSWNNMFRILSVEMWLALIISIVIVAISFTLLARYRCTSEWEGYETVTSSLTNIWALILGVSVPRMPRALSLRWLFLAWLCFSVAFSTVFQAFFKKYLFDSSFKAPIQNKDMLYESDSLLYYPQYLGISFENLGEEKVSKIESNREICPSVWFCLSKALGYKNVSIMFSDLDMHYYYETGVMLGENSEPLMCAIEGGAVYKDDLRMVMLRGDPLVRRVTDIINHVVQAGLYDHWISKYIFSNRFSEVFEGYYVFNLSHMKPAFYLLFMGWCLSAIFLMVELSYHQISIYIK